MGKKTNTLLFILGGTIINILITLASFFLIFYIYTRFILPMLPENSINWAMPLIFAASIVISFAAYRLLVKILIKKLDMNKHFGPIFQSRKR